MNFFDFINQYRVEEAKKLLADVETKRSILDIALMVGFNSTSTFYTAFKKFTGDSPVKFRKMNVPI
jgi:AraC-like DNA-binding protein